MKSFFTNIALLVTAFFALILQIANLAPFISPNLFALPQILGIIYPYILIINILITIIWIVKRKWVFLLPFVIIALGFQHILTLLSLNFSKSGNEIIPKAQTLKVASFNVRLFDLYNWSHNKNTRDNIMDYLKTIDADVICFQEYYDDKTNSFETTSRINKLQGIKSHKIAPTYIAKDLYRFGIATFSKYPIINSGEIQFENSQNNALWTDLLVSGDTIRVYNVHLQSNHFDTDDYKFIHKINTSPTSIEMRQIKGIFSRLNTAYKKRADQAAKVREHIQETKFPTIICADLNDTHLSYAYRKVKGKLSDAFQKSGLGFGHTFGSAPVSVRIDYIFFDKNFVSKSFQTGEGKLSDHNPIICTLERVVNN